MLTIGEHSLYFLHHSLNNYKEIVQINGIFESNWDASFITSLVTIFSPFLSFFLGGGVKNFKISHIPTQFKHIPISVSCRQMARAVYF